MSKVATNMKSVYELFIEETEKSEPDVDILESLIDRLQQEDIDIITVLNLSQKKLDELPDNIGNLTNLQYFNCSYNQISVLPDSIGNLANLLYFACRENKISVLPRADEEYSLSSGSGKRGYISSFASSSICNLTSLQELWINNNQIDELPNSIGNLTSLQEFFCGNNQISMLPDSIGNLTNLHKLVIIGNKISEIPESIGNLTNLHTARYYR